MSQSSSTSIETKNSEGWLFNPDTIESIRQLGSVLEGIHNRLISEGYTIEDGIISKGHESE